MDIAQLKCPACGSTELEKLRWNEYKCSHCGSMLILDSEGKRLELTGWVCPECGFNNPVGQRFCGQCGTKLVKACPRCRAENPLNMRYCGSCGFDYTLQEEFEQLGRVLLALRQALHKLEATRAQKGDKRETRKEQNLKQETGELEEVRAGPPSQLKEWIRAKQAEEQRQRAEEERWRAAPWHKKPRYKMPLIVGGGLLLLWACVAGLSAIDSKEEERAVVDSTFVATAVSTPHHRPALATVTPSVTSTQIPTSTPKVTNTVTPPPTAPSQSLCPNPHVRLTYPTQDAKLEDVAEIRGSADIDNFWYYKLEFRAEGEDEWAFLERFDKPATDGVLGYWDTSPLLDGWYDFRLVVVDNTGNYPQPCEVRVFVEH